MNDLDKASRFTGCLLGLAIGDAIGTTLEFQPKGSFTPITDMIGGGPFGLEPGQWTDDTSMALCLAESLLYCEGFDPSNQMNRYCNWMTYGYLSSTGECFDIGGTVSASLHKFLKTGDPFSGSLSPSSSGNGSIMRLCPVPMYYYPDFEKIIHYSGESSRTTHGAAECVDACKYFGVLIGLALSGATKEEILLQKRYRPQTENITRISSGKFLESDESSIRGNGYVVASLEAALWSFFTSDSFEESILKAANLGEDADTTAAICGQIAGAYYGQTSVPDTWLEKLHWKDRIEKIAIDLMLSGNSV